MKMLFFKDWGLLTLKTSRKKSVQNTVAYSIHKQFTHSQGKPDHIFIMSRFCYFNIVFFLNFCIMVVCQARLYWFIISIELYNTVAAKIQSLYCWYEYLRAAENTWTSCVSCRSVQTEPHLSLSLICSVAGVYVKGKVLLCKLCTWYVCVCPFCLHVDTCGYSSPNILGTLEKDMHLFIW